MKLEAWRTREIQGAPIQKLIAQSRVPENAVDLGQGVPFYGPPEEGIERLTRGLGETLYACHTPQAKLSAARAIVTDTHLTDAPPIPCGPGARHNIRLAVAVLHCC